MSASAFSRMLMSPCPPRQLREPQKRRVRPMFVATLSIGIITGALTGITLSTMAHQRAACVQAAPAQ